LQTRSAFARSRMTQPVSPCVVGFASCVRFVGVAIVDRGVKVRVTRVAGSSSGASERVRIAAWVECALARHRPGLVVLALHGPHDELVCEAAARQGYSTFDLERSEIAHLIGATAPTIAALRAAVQAHPKCSLIGARFLRRGAHGPRSDLDRYWAMPTLALAAIFAAQAVVTASPGGAQPPAPL